MSVITKIHEDYLKQSRLSSYSRLLEEAKTNGYKMVGILDFYRIVSERKNVLLDGERYLINRHDIDTSPRTARRMFEIEKKIIGKTGSATYYFRKTTIDKQLIHDIDSYGYESGYHYEEIATYEKKNKLREETLIREHLPEIRNCFLDNLREFRKDTKSKSLSVASHGDFVNTIIKMQNYELLKDTETRIQADIVLEAYDNCINQFVTDRFADHILVEQFSDEVIKCLSKKRKVILILTHPRNWEVDIVDNTRENIIRMLQGACYKL